MIKGVLFDFDGVLTLDETGSQSICNYLSKATNIDKNVIKAEYKKYNDDLLIGKIKHEDIWGDSCGAIGKNIKIETLYNSFINTPINAQVLSLAQNIKEIPLKVAMVTDNKADRIKSIVEYHYWDNLFDGIAVSAEVGSGKNQENIFHSIFQILGIKPEDCVFIDNKEDNLVVPKHLGVETIFFDFHLNDVVGLKQKLRALGIEL